MSKLGYDETLEKNEELFLLQFASDNGRLHIGRDVLFLVHFSARKVDTLPVYKFNSRFFRE